jgi:hypothetical protein
MHKPIAGKQTVMADVEVRDEGDVRMLWEGTEGNVL